MTDARLQPLLDALATHDLDAAAFVPGPNFVSLFGRDFHLMERPLVVVVAASGEAVAIVPDLEMGSFGALNFPGEVIPWRDQDGYEHAFDTLADALPGLRNTARLGIESQRMRAFEHMALQRVYPQATLVDAHSAISSMRVRKTTAQIEHLREAIRRSEHALEVVLRHVRAGMTEKMIESMLINALVEAGCDGLSFNPIVAAAGNAAEPHAHARDDYRIQPGDPLLIDFGGRYQGYNADITRTFFVERASDEHRAIYNAVLNANLAGIAAAAPGATAHDVDDAATASLEGTPYADLIVHKTGHGLGLDVHEAPQIMRGNHHTLEPGTVFTIEPGLYRADNIGVRIEDDVAITETGCEVLTRFPKTLQIVGTPA
ncbi:MAG: Xaa-Pro peptidase family protein [Pseudomonadota bacterium]